MIKYAPEHRRNLNGDWIKENGYFWTAGVIKASQDDTLLWEIEVPTMTMNSWMLFSTWLKYHSSPTIQTLTSLVKEYYSCGNPKLQWYDTDNDPSGFIE